MEYRTLGKTGLKVSAIGLGSWPIGGLVGGVIGERVKRIPKGWAGAVDDESIRTIRRAEDLGINLLHSSEIYGGGHAESIVGLAIRGRRDKFVIATKVRPLVEDDNLDNAARRIREALEGSLARLQTDYVDVHQLHTLPNEKTIPAVMDTYERLKKEGKVKWVGISSNEQDGIKKLLACSDMMAVVMIGYNLMHRDDEIVKFTLANNMGTMVISPFQQGALTGQWFGKAPQLDPMDKRYDSFKSPGAVAAFKKLAELEYLKAGGRRTMAQATLRFILDSPGISTILTGAMRPSEIEENAGAAGVPPLSADERARAMAIGDAARELWK